MGTFVLDTMSLRRTLGVIAAIGESQPIQKEVIEFLIKVTVHSLLLIIHEILCIINCNFFYKTVQQTMLSLL